MDLSQATELFKQSYDDDLDFNPTDEVDPSNKFFLMTPLAVER
jgi:hypothetical protein